MSRVAAIEKSEFQVEVMPDVSAVPLTRVLPTAMESIDDLGSQLAFDWDRRVFVAHSPSDIDPRSSKFREDMMPVCNTTLWVSIKDLLNRSWFERLWIWQEVQLAEDLISLVCGNIEIDFQHFCHAVRWLYKHRSDLPSLDQAYQIAHQISSKQSMSYTRSLTQLWYRMRRCKCSNERDRVYGMLNLTKINKIQTQILPDYTKSVQEVFQTLLMQQLSDESSLDLLKLCSLSDASSNLPTWLSWSMPPEFRRFGSGKADAGASPKAHCDGGDVLVVTGVSIADIAWASLGSGSWSEVSSSGSPQDYTSLTKAIENLMSESIGSLDIVVARPMIKSLCRSMYFHRCTEDYVPPRDSLVRFQEVVNSFEECWKISLNENTRSHLNHDRKGLLGACEMMRGRVTITTASGLLGIGPEGTREGDKVCIIIGCRNPLVLRHQENQHYQIVGECSVDGIMTGEAILGPLPSGCKLVTKRYPEHKAYFHAFLNCDTGETQIEDPRLGSLPPGWRVKSHNNQDVINWYVNDETGEDAEYKHPGLRIDALKKRGVKFEEFRLV